MKKEIYTIYNAKTKQVYEEFPSFEEANKRLNEIFEKRPWAIDFLRIYTKQIEREGE